MHHGRRLGAEFRGDGDGKNFADEIFKWQGRKFRFTAQNFWRPFFSHRLFCRSFAWPKISAWAVPYLNFFSGVPSLPVPPKPPPMLCIIICRSDWTDGLEINIGIWQMLLLIKKLMAAIIVITSRISMYMCASVCLCVSVCWFMRLSGCGWTFLFVCKYVCGCVI